MLLTFYLIVSRDDRVIWNLNSNRCYSAKSTWGALRARAPAVDWCMMVWLKNTVPRWAFIQWVAILSRLSTRDRLVAWRVADDEGCVMCHGGTESRDHLFFECQFTALVWESIKSKCGVYSPVVDLANEIRWGIQHCKGWATIFNLSLSASVYHIWRERNGRIFQQIGQDSRTVGRNIEVACACSWRNVPVTAENQRMRMEGTPLTVFKHIEFSLTIQPLV